MRERNIDDDVVATIVGVLDGWSGRLSWEALVKAVQRRAGLSYTRQTLHRHERIRLAFAVRKKALSGQTDQKSRDKMSPELQVALDRIARLEAENLRLAAENNALLEQFAVWSYNAQTRNLTNDFLNKPLPGVDREPSEPRLPKKPSATRDKNR
ncbi:hypothetical protein KDW49_28965 [Burkholderia dolosa]|nr:hypothetical protein [Burkholderia dolosa]